MKIGIISDIHSNINSLRLAFQKFQEENVEHIICLGDIIGIGPYPEKCIQFLIDKKDMICSIVRGNHENYLINGIPKRNHNDKNGKILNAEEIGTHTWNHNRLNNSQRDFIYQMKNRDIINLKGRKIVIEHYPMDSADNHKEYYSYQNAEILSELFEEKNADVYLFGHTHKEFYEVDNKKHFINPGSLGCPANTHGACFGILNLEDNLISYEQIKIEYDIEKVINDIKKENYPLNSFMINTFYK